MTMRDGPVKGLELVDDLLKRGELAQYHLTHATRADFCRRLDRKADARVSYERALALTKQEPERRFLEKRRRDWAKPLPHPEPYDSSRVFTTVDFCPGQRLSYVTGGAS